MNLEELIPRKTSFKLRNYDFTFTMNPINLTDEIWLKKEFGDDISIIFEEIRIYEISRIVFRLMDIDSKKQIKSQVIEVMSEDGEITEERIGGLNLFTSMISGLGDKEAILTALVENIGLSRPDTDENKDQPKKKVQNKILTGLKSLI